MKKVLVLIGIIISFFNMSFSHCISQQHSKKIAEVIRANAAGGQLNFDEYALIAEKVASRAPCNVLVFGVGNDSSLWMEVNKGGKTVFLEDNPEWLAAAKKRLPSMKSYLVTYGTKRIDWKRLLTCPQRKCLEMTLPPEVSQVRWDVIFVDAPFGGTDNSPGRMKSIYASSKLAFKHKKVDVFVHDCNRIVENIYCNSFLLPKNLKKSIRLLRHYYIP